VRPIESVAVWSRSAAAAERLVTQLTAQRIKAHTVSSVEAGMADATLIITVTPSHSPLVPASALREGMHITAVGSDGPHKQELEVEVLARADVLVADRTPQCALLGEIHHALEAGAITTADVDAELGDLVLGSHPGRTSADQITVCDLTGVGVQDAAIASVALERFLSRRRFNAGSR
jgi:ornithine cyclodeaminase